MQFLRKRFTARFLAVFFLLLIIESTIHTSVSYALTTGPHQPEYTSYEEPGATDMVNLLTGDFNFSLPLLEVPGPEGGFSVPVTYNAGIGPDQEASWIGLGWTCNIGAITRSVVQYPDDASGEVQSITRKDLDGVRGWTSSTLGLGQTGWNTEQGHYGALSLLSIVNVSWDKAGTTVGVAGINVGPNGVTFDGVQFLMAAFTIATMGAGSIEDAAMQAGISIGVGADLSFFVGNQTPNSPTDGYWEYSKRTSSGFLGIWENYWIWLDQTRYEQMLGVLNFDKAATEPHQGVNWHGITAIPITIRVNGGTYDSPTQFKKTGNSQGVASDVSYYIPSGTSFKDATSPVALATDNYSVKAPGISGSIKPYRLDVSSVSMPREMSIYHARLVPVAAANYKVPFIYEGSNSNSYCYQVGTASTAVTAPRLPYYGLYRDFKNRNLNYGLDDYIFETRIQENIAATNKIPMSNHTEWLTNEDISSVASGFATGFMDYFSGSDRSQFRKAFTFGPPKYIYSASEDFTNGRISVQKEELAYFIINQPISINVSAYDYTQDFSPDDPSRVDFTINTTVTAVSPASVNGPWYVDVAAIGYVGVQNKYCQMTVNAGGPKRPNSIGGYSITGINGLTYHFALPAYEYGNYTKIQDAYHPDTKYSEIKRDEPFASTWLLTGVTGTDFVDRGGINNTANGVIDINDWGYWVKFNYGKFSDDFQWNTPYNGATLSQDGQSLSSSQGHRQIFYLNSIETRTHVAMFIKDLRNDNRGKNSGVSNSSGVSLRLSEIDLMTREVYEKLFASTGEGGFGLVSDAGLSNINKLWMNSDFFAAQGSHPAHGSHLIQNAIKRIKFTHTYDLCPNTDNSIAPNKGKLTLTRISLIGRNESKLIPDYTFEYGFNPSYNANQWDGWGMYSPFGATTGGSHTASPNNSDGAAWSLTRIINPMGSTIEVAYERDTYSTVSGNQLYKTTPTSFVYTNTSDKLFWRHVNVADGTQFYVGQQVHIAGNADYSCDLNFSTNQFAGNNSPYDTDAVVQYISGNRLDLGYFRESEPCSPNTLITRDLGTITTLQPSKPGGNIRVASIVLKDQNQQFKTRYLYNLSNGNSAGVVAREPEYVKNPATDLPVYNLPGYPFTPVMYSMITILSGNLTDDSDYHTRQVYEFETPNSSMFTNVNTSNPSYQFLLNKNDEGHNYYYNAYVKDVQNIISDNTAKIGKMTSVKMYSKTGELISSSSMEYGFDIATRDANTGLNKGKYQGFYAESSLMYDRIGEKSGASGQNTFYEYNRMARTTILKYPSLLKKVTSFKDGFTSTNQNNSWDFVSGLVVEKTATSALGLKIKTITIPAYAKYPMMGSKAEALGNKNMLGHEAATYTYLLDDSNDAVGLLHATAQTWNENWSYRSLSGGTYNDLLPQSDVWRKHKTFVYKGSYGDLRTDGSLNFTSLNEFDFSSATNSNWQNTNEITRYDHYSETLEGKDLKGIYSSAKKDIGLKRIVAGATNATYTEFAYSGAEDWDDSGTGDFLGGEVAKGSTAVPVYKTTGFEVHGSDTHTGKMAIQLTSGNKGFIYKPSSLKNNRVYRVSVWTNSLSGAIYYSLNNQTEQTIAPVSTMKAGAWYQINAEIPVTTFSTLEVGVKSAGGIANFDDFRFQPRDGAVTAHVFDAITGQTIFALDNQNMFTQYLYNDRSQLTKTYSESFLYGVKLISETKSNYKGFNVEH